MSTRGAIPKKFSRNVLLLKNDDFTRISDQVYMPTASEISKIKHSVQLGQFKRKVEFDASMSEDRIKKKLEETFPYLVNRRFSCAAVVKVDKDSSRFEFHGSPHIWGGKTIRSKIKGNSALYILEDEALNSETETSTSIPQGDNDDMNCLATVVNQISLLDDSQMMEIEESQQVTPGAETVESGHISMHQDQLQMSDSSEGILSSFDNNATSSGIGGEFSEEEYSCMAQWVQNNVDYEVCINPQESPLQGGAPCCFSFYPELQPEVTSGHAKFGYAAPVELERLRNGSLLGTIPASQVPGWVPVIIESQDGTYLGRTAIKYHGDQMEEALQQIVVDPSLQKRFFEKYNMFFNSGGNLETSGGETQNSGTPGSVQMLSLLVYAAAESGAQQFIEMIFTSSAGRVVYDAYKDRPLLPEVIAKKYGNEKTANYLQEITKRFSEEIRTGQECSHIIDWSELVKAAEAAQKQLGLTSEENYQLESDVSKETGYLGDAETSSSESSDLQSSDSDDDISTTFRKAGALYQEDEIQLERNLLEDRNEDTKDQREVEIKPFAVGTLHQEDEIQLEINILEDHNEDTKDQPEVEIKPFSDTVGQEDEIELERNLLEDHNEDTKDQHEVEIKPFAVLFVGANELEQSSDSLDERNNRDEESDEQQLANEQEEAKGENVVPPEILARDLALDAYNKALAEGMTCVKRVPIMFIGQDRSGKTSLKKTLRGKCFNPDEDSTVGIDVDPSHFKVSTEIWKAGEKNQIPDSDTTMSCEYHAARLVSEKLREEKSVPEEKVMESVQPRHIPLVNDAVSSRVSSYFTLDVPSHVPSVSSHDLVEFSGDLKDSESSEITRDPESIHTSSDQEPNNKYVPDTSTRDKSDLTQWQKEDTPLVKSEMPEEILKVVDTLEGEEDICTNPMLMSHPPEAIIKLVASAQIPSLFIRFESGHVPPGLFPRMVLQFFQWGKEEFWSPMNPQLYHNFARFYSSGDEDCSVILLCHSSSIEIVVHRGNFSLGLADSLQSKMSMYADLSHDTVDVTCARAVCRQVGLMLKNMRYDLGVICPVCCQGCAVIYCPTHRTQDCKQEECLHFWSESELRGGKHGILCTRSAAAQNNKVQVKQFAPWFATLGEQERQKNPKRAEKEINQELEDLINQLQFDKDEEMSIQATTAVTENTAMLKQNLDSEVTSKEFDNAEVVDIEPRCDNISQAEMEQLVEEVNAVAENVKEMNVSVEIAVKHLRDAANYLDQVWKNCKVASATESSANILGSLLLVGEIAAAFIMFGVAAPVMLARRAIEAAGARTNQGASYIEASANSSIIQAADVAMENASRAINSVKKKIRLLKNGKSRHRLVFLAHLASEMLGSNHLAVALIEGLLRSDMLAMVHYTSAVRELALRACVADVTTAATRGLVKNCFKEALNIGVTVGARKAAGKVGTEAAARAVSKAASEVRRAIGKAGSKAAFNAAFTAGNIAFLIIDAKELTFTVRDIVNNNKGSDAARYLRNEANEMEEILHAQLLIT